MTTQNTDQWARAIVVAALGCELDHDPMLAEVHAVMGVARLETYYGRAWKSPPHAADIVGGNNWGAVQCRDHWKQCRLPVPASKRPDLSALPVPTAVAGHCALVVDSSPTKAGASWYAGPYRCYPTAIEGARHVVRTLLRMGVVGAMGVANESRTVQSVSRRMYERGYYQGTHTEAELAIADHAAALTRNLLSLARACGEAPGLGTGAGRPPEVIVPVPLEWSNAPPELSPEETIEAEQSLCMVVSWEEYRADRARQIQTDTDRGRHEAHR